MSDKSPHLQHEADYIQKKDGQTLKRLRERNSTDPRSSYQMWAMGSHGELIQSFTRSSFTLPAGTARFVGQAAADELQELLYRVWELNERFVGQRVVEGLVQINGTVEQREIIEQSLEWARDYVARRLKRKNPRDRDCPYRKFLRLYGELVPFVDRLGILGGGETLEDAQIAAVTGQYLAQMCDYIAWTFYEATWATEVVWEDNQVKRLRYRPGLDLESVAECKHKFELYSWSLSRVFDVLVARMAKGLAADTDACSPQQERARIAQLTDDIHQMKPFLVRNFRQSRTRLELPGGISADFGWAENARPTFRTSRAGFLGN